MNDGYRSTNEMVEALISFKYPAYNEQETDKPWLEYETALKSKPRSKILPLYQDMVSQRTEIETLLSLEFPGYPENIKPIPINQPDRNSNSPLNRLIERSTELSREVSTRKNELIEIGEDGLENLTIIKKALGKKMYEEQEAARPYNQQDAQADFEYLAKQAYWRPLEIAAILMGKNPKVVTSDSLKEFRNCSPKSAIPKFVNEYDELMEHVLRAVRSEELEADQNPPRSVLDWADARGHEYPKELAKAVAKWGKPIKDWKAEAVKLQAEIAELKGKTGDSTNKTSETKTIQTLQKMVTGLVLVSFDQDPKIQGTSLVKEIVDGFLKYGITINSDTVRTHIRSSVESAGDYKMPNQE